MENKEDILKEFEDFAARQETNPNFTLSFTKDQFGEETLLIKLYGIEGQLKNKRQRIISLLLIFIIFVIPFTFIFKEIMIFFYVLVIILSFFDTVFEINKETITKKRTLFNKIVLQKKAFYNKNIKRFEVVTNSYRAAGGSELKFKLNAVFSNESRLLFFKSTDMSTVTYLEKVIEKFLGISDKITSIRPEK